MARQPWRPSRLRMRSPPPGFGSPSKLVGTGAAGPSSSIASTDEIKTPPLIFDRGFEPVSAETQPVSRRLPIQISDIEKSPSSDSMEVLPPSVRDARISSPETGLLAANLRKCRHFRECPKTLATDRYGWLGREDSNRDVSNSKRSLQGSAADWMVGARSPDLSRTGDYERRSRGARRAV